MREDLYQLLGLRRDASLEEIKKAYRQLAKRHHPDRTQNNPRDTEIFKAVAVAFATLSNPQKRAEYDRLLAATERGDCFWIHQAKLEAERDRCRAVERNSRGPREATRA